MVRGMCKGGARGAKVHEEYILRYIKQKECWNVVLNFNLLNLERLKPNKLCHQLDPTGGHCILDILDTFLLTQHETCHGQTCEIRNCRFNTVLVNWIWLSLQGVWLIFSVTMLMVGNVDFEHRVLNIQMLIAVALPWTTHTLVPECSRINLQTNHQTYICSQHCLTGSSGRGDEKNDNTDRNDQKKTTHQFNWKITTFAIDCCCITGWEIYVEKDTTTRIRTG